MKAVSGAGPNILFQGSGMAARTHARTLRRDFPRVGRIYASRSAGRAEALAKSEGGTVHRGGWEGALQDPGIDAVLITTPPALHLEQTLAALEAGKHVIVEKPAYLSLDEFDAVQAAAERAGRQVLVAENYHYKPLARGLRRIIESGDLGQIRIVEINAVKQQPANGWRSDPGLAGGGSLFEGGIHWVSLLANLGLEVETAHGFFPAAPPRHERSTVFVAEFAQGAVGILTYSWEIPSTLKGLRLSRIWGTNRSLLFESNGLGGLRTGGALRPFFPGLADIQGYRAMMADFVHSIVTGKPPEYTLSAARRDVELVLSAYAGADRDPLNGRHA